MYENGKREPDLVTLEEIADFFNVNTLLDSKSSIELSDTRIFGRIKNRSEMRMLFKLAKGATKEEVEKAVKIIEALKESE